jgi:hypothetical protein
MKALGEAFEQLGDVDVYIASPNTSIYEIVEGVSYNEKSKKLSIGEKE